MLRPECSQVVVIGAALVDQIAKVKPEFLLENNLEANATYHCNGDSRLVSVLQDFERIYASEIISKPGGSALNTAYYYNFLFGEVYKHTSQLENLFCSTENQTTSQEFPDNCFDSSGNPAKFLFVGLVGDDEQSDLLKKDAKKSGLNALWVENIAKTTGRCSVMISGQNRCLLSLGGANEVKPESILHNSELTQIIESAKCVYIVAFLLLHDSYFAFIKIAETVSTSAGKFICNLSSHKILETEEIRNRVWSLITFSDYVIGNEEEYKQLTGCCEAHDAILNVYWKIEKNREVKRFSAIMTRGDQSTLAVTNGIIEQFPVGSSEAVKVVDTNGAGDAFVAGFLFGIGSGKQFRESIQLANETAFRSMQTSDHQLV